MQPLIAIVGPTAAGKSELGVRLAKKFDGEVVSADSRQVYRGLDIGSGKIAQEEMRGVPHHLLDAASPRRSFTVAQYRTLALKTIKDIQERGKLPFLVGGSPFYVYAVTDGIWLPEVPPDEELRKELSQYPVEELYVRLRELDPQRAETIEQKNPRRLVRALEIVLKTGKPVPKQDRKPLPFPILFLGIRKPSEDLRVRIAKRLQKRISMGMIEEVQNLHKKGISWRRLEELGLEYRAVARYLRGAIPQEEMVQRLETDIWRFSKRQMAWFKKDERIRWVQDYPEAEQLVRSFLR